MSLLFAWRDTKSVAENGNDANEKIDVQLQQMKRSYREEQTFAGAIDAYKDTYSFEDCWSPLGIGFEELKSFAGGIATVMPGTSSVEADFSLINWHKDPNAKAMTDFSLESILHCKQQFGCVGRGNGCVTESASKKPKLIF